MRKRRLLAVAGVLSVVAWLALLVLALKPADPGVTKANFDRIKVGMSRAEVEEIFGRPADATHLRFIPTLLLRQVFQCDST